MLTRPLNLEQEKDSHPFKRFCRQFIKENFSKLSQREIARRLQIGKTTVNKWAKGLNLIFRKHTVSENYFKKWSPNMAYILGYISADGNVAWNEIKGYYSMTVTAAEKDKDHLEKIRNILESTKPLLYGASTKSYRLVINSKQICRDLMKFGISPKKSLTLKFPNIPDKYLKDYIRGYVDGDGSLKYFNRRRSPYFELTICSGSKQFIETLENKIFEHLNVHSRITKTSCYILRYSCDRAIILARWLYKDADLYLLRKYNKFEIALCSRKD